MSEYNKLTTKDVIMLISLGGVICASVAMPGLPVALKSAIDIWKNVRKSDIARIIHRLSTQEMISISDNGIETIIKLTDKGKAKVLKYNFDNLKLRATKIDGKRYIVSFDIPEKQKKARDIFTKKLLALGFIRFQDSMYICAYPCSDEVDFLAHYLNISKHVSLFTLDKLYRGEQIKIKKLNQLYS